MLLLGLSTLFLVEIFVYLSTSIMIFLTNEADRSYRHKSIKHHSPIKLVIDDNNRRMSAFTMFTNF
jgi:hypothetical protein